MADPKRVYRPATNKPGQSCTKNKHKNCFNPTAYGVFARIARRLVLNSNVDDITSPDYDLHFVLTSILTIFDVLLIWRGRT